MNPDDYYGDKARNYDKLRSGKSFWKREDSFLEKHLTLGPVIDIPVGTGRFIDLYNRKKLAFIGVDISDDMLTEARNKHPDALLQLGSIFDIAYADDSFGTAVCSRMLHWLYPDDMVRAMKQVCRVASDVIVSVRLGDEGIQPGLKTYTHDERKFLEAVGNKLIAGRSTLQVDGDNLFEMFKFRELDRNEDFISQFSDRDDANATIDLIAGVWFRRFGFPMISPLNAKMTVEVWDSEKFSTVLHHLQSLADAECSEYPIITDQPPRRLGKPPVYFKYKGNYGPLDGRRRSNKFMREGGLHQVIVLDLDS